MGSLCFSRWQGIVGFLVFSPLAGPGYAVPVLNTLSFPQYAVPVLDTLCLSSIRWAVLSLCLSSIRCSSSRYAVPVVNTLSWPFAVPVPIRNWILTLIPLYTRTSRAQEPWKQIEIIRTLKKILTWSKIYPLCPLGALNKWHFILLLLYDFLLDTFNSRRHLALIRSSYEFCICIHHFVLSPVDVCVANRNIRQISFTNSFVCRFCRCISFKEICFPSFFLSFFFSFFFLLERFPFGQNWPARPFPS